MEKVRPRAGSRQGAIVSIIDKLKLKLRPLRYNRKKILLGFLLIFLLYYFFGSQSTNRRFTSIINCKSDLAKIAIPSQSKRLDYLQPVGTDFNTIEEDFFYFISTLTTNCKSQEHLGPPEDGGWDVCLEQRYDVRRPCLVYSFGVNEDFRFEKDVERILRCEIHAFDPSLGLKSFKFSTNGFFHDYGIDNVETIDMKTGWKMKKMQNIMQELGHSGKTIDYMKMDVEFSEWLVLNDLISSQLLHNIRQLSLEIHTPEVDILSREGDQCSRTNPETLTFMFRTLVDLRNAGFSLFSSRTNHRIKFVSQISGKERFCCHNLHFVNTKHPRNAF